MNVLEILHAALKEISQSKHSFYGLVFQAQDNYELKQLLKDARLGYFIRNEMINGCKLIKQDNNFWYMPNWFSGYKVAKAPEKALGLDKQPSFITDYTGCAGSADG